MSPSPCSCLLALLDPAHSPLATFLLGLCSLADVAGCAPQMTEFGLHRHTLRFAAALVRFFSSLLVPLFSKVLPAMFSRSVVKTLRTAAVPRRALSSRAAAPLASSPAKTATPARRHVSSSPAVLEGQEPIVAVKEDIKIPCVPRSSFARQVPAPLTTFSRPDTPSTSLLRRARPLDRPTEHA